jgi:hypothetical protein
VGGAGGGQRRGVVGGHQLAVAQLDGVERPARQGGQEARQLLGEAGGRAHLLRRELEEEGAALCAQPLDERRHHLLGGVGRVEEVRVRAAALGAEARQVGPADEGDGVVRLDDEAEVFGDGGGVGGQLIGGEGLVVGAVDADGAEERVAGVGGEPLLRQPRGGVAAVVDQAAPAGEGPRGAAEAELGREYRGQLAGARGRGGGADRRRARRSGVAALEEVELAGRFFGRSRHR